MATKKKQVKKTKATGKGLYTTIALVESKSPCSEGYYPVLQELGAEPLDKERYDDFEPVKGRKKSKIGPNSKVYLSDLLKISDGPEIVGWILSQELAEPENLREEANSLISALGAMQYDDRAEFVLILLDPKSDIKKVRKFIKSISH